MKRPSLKFCRRVSQLTVLVVMALVPVLNAKDWHLLSGNFFYFDAAGIPLGDPLATLQMLLSSREWVGEALAGALTTLALAAFLGPVFCSWACPFGLLSELGNGLRARMNGHFGLVPSRAFWFKLLLTTAGLVLIGLLGLPPLLNHLSMPGWYARIFQQLTWEAALVLAVPLAGVLALEAFFRQRLWCRWLCPQSVLLALSGRASPRGLRVNYRPERCFCGKGSPCRRACSLGLDPRRPGGAGLECNNCGDCVVACADNGRALSFSQGQSGVKAAAGRESHQPRQNRSAGDKEDSTALASSGAGRGSMPKDDGLVPMVSNDVR